MRWAAEKLGNVQPQDDLAQKASGGPLNQTNRNRVVTPVTNILFLDFAHLETGQRKNSPDAWKLQSTARVFCGVIYAQLPAVVCIAMVV